MKKAFVHDWIVHEGGAEAVLKHMVETSDFDDARIFTLFSLQKTIIIGNRGLQIVTALPEWINNIFIRFNTRKILILSKLFDYRNLMFWFPLLCAILRKKVEGYKPDETTISSFAAVKNIVNNKQHIGRTTLYIHSPMQYIWENYMENVQKLSFPIRQLYQIAALYLRPWDKKPRNYDAVLCNSNYTARLAEQLYGLESQVKYPIIDNAFINEPIINTSREYFVFVGRVQKYVREIGKVIEACNKTKQHLMVIGDGPDMEYAKSIAGPTIIFLGRISDVHEKIDIMKHAKGFINIAKESFGIATAEALCLGIPVIGFNGGATQELVGKSANGVLIDDKMNGLVPVLQDFHTLQFDRKEIAARARERFAPKRPVAL